MGVAMITVMLVIGPRDSSQVPASQSEKFWEEIANVKIMMASIADELEKFNSHYLTKLETRMMTIASLLGHIDSNVKNVQERAHVWDTFQLHVAAWNEQINTLDKKVDILSRGHEKISLMDGKVSALVNLDYKVERLVRKMDDADNKLTIITKTLDNQREDPLFGEFATRGILSTLKVIERKVDHIDTSVFHGKTSRNWTKSSIDDKSDMEGGEEAAVGRGKLVIKCNTPVAVEELLRDVASKVDVIFDKVGQEQDDEEVETRTEGFFSDDLMEQPSKENAETKLLEKLWKRLTSPNKKTSRAIEAMEKSVRFVENTTTAMWTEHTSMMNRILSCCLKSEKNLNSFSTKVDYSLKLVEASVNNSQRDDVMTKRFDQQNTHLESFFKRINRQCANETTSEKLKEEEVTTNAPFAKQEEVSQSTQPRLPGWIAEACEDFVGTDSVSGEYSFGNLEVNGGGRDFSRRYCEMGPDMGGWTLIQRRGDFSGERQNFSLMWEQYKHGFGDFRKEFWFGNDFLNRLTTQREVTLRVELEDFDGSMVWAHYTKFRVETESELYRLRIGGYTGNSTDSFSAHDGVPFSTADRVNDAAPPCCPCAPAYGGGWWFDSCFESNLNGVYYGQFDEREHFRGIIWEHWRGNSSLRATRMMIRPSDRNRSSETTVDVPEVVTPTSSAEGITELPEDP